MSLSLDLRFTDPAAPLFIDIEGDNSESMFVISTSQVHGAATGAPTQHYQPPNNKKRERQDSPNEAKNKRPMKAVQIIDRVLASSRFSLQPAQIASQESVRETRGNTELPHNDRGISLEPLFLPESSQLSVTRAEAIRSSGLGVEKMDADELAQMLEGEGEEVAFDFSSQRQPEEIRQTFSQELARAETECSDNFDLQIDEGSLEPSQILDNSKASPRRPRRVGVLTHYV